MMIMGGCMIKFFKKLCKILFQDECYYITNGTALLPEKLDPEEERELVKQIHDGNMDAKKELIERNLRLVVYIAQKFSSTGLCVDDLTSVGTIGLIKAASSFDGDKNIKFATFASRCIENEILMYLRKVGRIKGEVSLDEPLSVDKDGNELVLADVLGCDGDVLYKSVEQKMECSNLNTLIEKLSNREKIIMKLRYGLNDAGKELTQKEVASTLNISQSYISRIEKKVLDKLKVMITAN